MPILVFMKAPAPELVAARDAYLDLRRVHEHLTGEFDALFKRHGLTHAWFNVLRILAGGPAEGTACGDLGSRLVNRVPDVTRLLDRMETAGLIERARDGEDRRVVRTRLTDLGREKLRVLENPVGDLHLSQFAGLSLEDVRALDATLRRLLPA